jgi:hypothetical protein
LAGAPHFEQKRSPESISWPQMEQNIVCFSLSVWFQQKILFF